VNFLLHDIAGRSQRMDDSSCSLHEVQFEPARRQRASEEAGIGLARDGADYVAEALSPDMTIVGWFVPPEASGIRGLRARQGEQLYVARRKHRRHDVWHRFPDHPFSLESGFAVVVRLQLGWNVIQLEFKEEVSRRWREFAVCRVWLSPWWPLKARVCRPACLSEYETWARLEHDPSALDLRAMRTTEAALADRPLLSVLMPTYNTPAKWLERAIESVRAQTYSNWELCIADDGSQSRQVRRTLRKFAARDPRIRITWRLRSGHICNASNSALENCRGVFTVLMDHDDELAPDALFHVAERIVHQPDVMMIFSDEDKIDESGVRSGPYFKPGWNYDLLLGENCVSHMGAFRTSLLREIGGFRPGFEGSQDWDLALRVVERVPREAVAHIPRVLYHWRILPQSTASSMDAKPYARVAARRAVEDHLARHHPGVRMEELPEPHDGWRLHWPLPASPPLVSIVVSSLEPLDDVRDAVETVERITTYANYEILVMDTGLAYTPAELALRDWLSTRAKVRVINAAGLTGWSRLNNHAARESLGTVLLFLNPSLRPSSPDWLRELCSQACRAGVGAVGGQLLDLLGTIQHGGIVLGMNGSTGHLFRNWRPDANTIGGRPDLVREVTAVTGDCLAVMKSRFEEAGGFDEATLPDVHADLDLCLRLRSSGLRQVCTPFASLVFQSTRTACGRRARARRAAEVEQYSAVVRRWHLEKTVDPYFNPNLSLQTEVPVLGRRPVSIGCELSASQSD
jgi:GT2 family glycosyltransferase